MVFGTVMFLTECVLQRVRSAACLSFLPRACIGDRIMQVQAAQYALHNLGSIHLEKPASKAGQIVVYF